MCLKLFGCSLIFKINVPIRLIRSSVRWVRACVVIGIHLDVGTGRELCCWEPSRMIAGISLSLLSFPAADILCLECRNRSGWTAKPEEHSDHLECRLPINTLFSVPCLVPAVCHATGIAP